MSLYINHISHYQSKPNTSLIVWLLFVSDHFFFGCLANGLGYNPTQINQSQFQREHRNAIEILRKATHVNCLLQLSLVAKSGFQQRCFLGSPKSRKQHIQFMHAFFHLLFLFFFQRQVCFVLFFFLFRGNFFFSLLPKICIFLATIMMHLPPSSFSFFLFYLKDSLRIWFY